MSEFLFALIILSTVALWFGTNKNRDVSTGSLACPFARLLALLTRLLALDCLLRSRPPLRSLVRSLAYFAHSLARGTVNDWMAILSVFFVPFSTIVHLQLSKAVYAVITDCGKEQDEAGKT